MKNPSIPYAETIANAKKMLESLGSEYEVKINNINGLDEFWVSELKTNLSYMEDHIYISGKGGTKEESLASAFAEAVERISWIIGSYQPLQFITDLYTGDKIKFSYDDYRQYYNPTSQGLAAGNTYAEAFQHALQELYEVTLNRNNVGGIFNVNKSIFNLQSLIDVPDSIANNFNIAIEKDERFPYYYVVANKFPQPIEILNKGFYVHEGELFYEDKRMNEHNRPVYKSPTYGQRISRSVKEAVPAAMNEIFQKHFIYYKDFGNDTEIKLFDDIEKQLTSLPIKNIEDYIDYTIDDVDDDNVEILSLFKPYCNFMGYFDFTPKVGGLKVIQLVSDFDPAPNMNYNKFMRTVFKGL